LESLRKKAQDEVQDMADAQVKISSLQEELREREQRIEKLFDLVKRTQAGKLLETTNRLEAQLESSEEENRRLKEENLRLRELLERRTVDQE
jgi:hypothetical protein